ncbi:MAG: hypothetical protein SGJ19_10675 [Planctomycetia bacterium]|mgnify:CR=1 FL=1|nr:hypothetical protein [Planctomycetia bacterium]
MKTRREARQLSPGDQFHLTLTIQVELSEAEQHDDGRVTLRAKVVPCGPRCGEECECKSSVFKDTSGPFEFNLHGTQRVPYFGNLQQLLADSERIKKQIARLTGAEGDSAPHESLVSSHPITNKVE